MKLFKKILIVLIIFFVLIFIYQITFAQNISFSNDIVDHFFHFTQTVNAVFIFFLLLCLLFINSKETWQKVITGILVLPVILFLLLGVVMSSGIVFARDETNMRHYFFNKDGYNYYLVSERFWAFEGSSNLKIYKEKPLFLFVKERLSVDENELINNKVDYVKEYQIFLNQRF